jgi:hypothetical protein
MKRGSCRSASLLSVPMTLMTIPLLLFTTCSARRLCPLVPCTPWCTLTIDPWPYTAPSHPRRDPILRCGFPHVSC